MPAMPSAGTPRHTRHPLWAIFFAGLSFVIFATLFRYDGSQYAWAPDIWMTSTNVDKNSFGIVGATFALWSFRIFGVSAWMLGVFAALLSFYMLRLRDHFSLYWKCFEMLLALIALSVFFHAIPDTWIGYSSKSALVSMKEGPGGYLGAYICEIFAPFFGLTTLALASAFAYVVLFCSICMTSLTRVIGKIIVWLKSEYDFWRERHKERAAKRQMERELAQQRRLEEERRRAEEGNYYGASDTAPVASDVDYREAAPETQECPPPATIVPAEPVPANDVPEEVPEAPVVQALPSVVAGTLVIEESADESDESPSAVATVSDAGTLERADAGDLDRSRGEYVFPPLDLLQEPPRHDEASTADHLARGDEIVKVLKQFNCEATLSAAHVGPTVTRYEVRPAPGQNVSRVLNQGDNIAVNIAVKSARIKSIPENGTIGIEVPNPIRQTVYIREILESKAWAENKKMAIPAVLGKDVTGKPVLLDMAKMPHGLIAGTSGSGKSVCLNGILTSLLYRMSPDELRLIIVDPKAVELGVYNKAPHMLIPVITDIRRAPGAVKYLIDEMERRYQLLMAAGVRDIKGFNQKIEDLKKAPAAAQTVAVPRDEGVEDELTARKKLPYIVCIIDEFGDIMAGPQRAEIENGVQRLTAKSRAAGIHLLIATQRPDAKTITGLIKANLGTRIALRVTSGINSNIILDEGGAETLIGNGDMLVLKPTSPDLERAQGVWVSENEIDSIVNFLCEQNGPPQYSDDVTSIIDGYTEDEEGTEDEGGEGLDGDELLAKKAWDIIYKTKRASTSWLQTRLKIGYGKATRIITALEANGYVGPASGPKSIRDILKDHWDGIDMDKDL